MNHTKRAEMLGKIVGNLHSLEFLLRVKLFNRSPRAQRESMKSVNLLKSGVGDTVPKNPLTDYSSLGELIKKYNRIAGKQKRIKRDELVKLRDAIAHGRVFAETNEFNRLKLIKFSPPNNNKVKVVFSQMMTEQWLQDKNQLVLKALKKVHEG